MTVHAEHIVRNAFPDVLERVEREAYQRGRREALEEAAKMFDYPAWVAMHWCEIETPVRPTSIAAAIRSLIGCDKE